jgi:MHS family proline/betaine transporter-like MFS transporter
MSFKHQSRIILGAVLGNLIEAFDMAICGLLSVYLAKYLMGDANKGLLLVFITFFAGYLARPLGAFLLGLFSDVYGRKITLAASIIAMGIATSGIGIIPSNASIGHYSMVLLLILRVIQSFSCGVEYLNSTAYLVENSNENQKGFAGSWASFGSTAGLLLASVMAFYMNWCVARYPDLEWLFWRLPFILALLGSSIGLYIRLYLPESLEYIVYYSEKPKPAITSILKNSLRYCLSNKVKTVYVFVLSCLGVTSTFLFYIFGPTQAHISGYFSENQIMISNILSLIALLAVYPIAGKLTDKINQEKLIVIAASGLLVCSYLFFYALSEGNFMHFLLIQLLISIPSGIYYATVPVMLTNMFPINLRCTVLSVIYSVAASLSAGLTPLFSFLLIQKTHLTIAPCFIIAGIVGLIFGILILNISKPRTMNLQQCA